MSHKFSKDICQKINDGDALGAKYEYSNRSDMRNKDDGSLFTRTRFMLSNLHDQQANGLDDNPKRSVDNAEELEALKASIAENEQSINQLETQLQKLEESIKKVREDFDEIVRIGDFSMKNSRKKQRRKSKLLVKICL